MTTYPLLVVEFDDPEVGAAKSSGFQRIAPVVSPGALRPAVDQKLHGIFLAGVEVGRLDQEAFDFVVVSAGEPEGFERGHGDLGQNGVVEMGQLAGVRQPTFRQWLFGFSEKRRLEIVKTNSTVRMFKDKNL